ncbi:NXPE family member 1-like isoform X2 [Anneissia japonica]|uniref:NXPE family member 1-like isoform X2 n=1 Tax=Anneissia japonica TaxID=1529436 RepID=UPI00142551E4|nr:NXPE family member 1-like isoform X2 [Anneissia japonica]
MRNTKAIKYTICFITSLLCCIFIYSLKWDTRIQYSIHKAQIPMYRQATQNISIFHTGKNESLIEDITKTESGKIIMPAFASIKEARLKTSSKVPVPVSKQENTGLINSSKTTVILKNPGVVKVGEFFSVIIEARNSMGQHRVKGGEFWLASIRSRQANAAGKVIDFNNGTYEAIFFAAWTGNVNIEIILVNPSETSDFIEDTFWHMEDRGVWKGNFVSGKIRETKLCRLRIKGDFLNKCEWSQPLATGKTIFVCDKPSKLGCETLASLKSTSILSNTLSNLTKLSTDITRRSLNYARLLSTPAVNITEADQESTLLDRLSLPECKADLPTPLSDGFWTGKIWTSLQCKTRQWTGPEISRCIKGKEIIFMGDSTTEQWCKGMLNLMKVSNNNYTRKLSTKHITHHSNIMNFDFYFHPYSFGSRTHRYRVGKWEYEVLDNLNFSACNYVIMVSPWAHYTQWVKESLLERLHLLRETLIRFRKRCPNAHVLMKSPHPRNHQKGGENVYVSEKMLFDIYELYHEIFSGLGIHIIDIWDMNLAYPHANTIHMPMAVVYQELFMMFSHVCSKGPT